MSGPAVCIDGAGVVLGGAHVLADITVAVARAEWLGLVGPNGAGKTTLLRVLCGQQRATGDVVVDGCRAGQVPARTLARHVAVVTQTPEVPGGMTVGEYVLLGRTAHVSWFGQESRHDHAVARAVTNELGLADLTDRPLSTLSGGERQRAVLARALAQEAPVLLLDEPTSALDLGHQLEVLELVDRLRRDRHLTVVAAIHDLTLAGRFCDRLALLDRGRLVVSGPPAAVLTAELVGRHWGVDVDVTHDLDGPVVVPRRAHDRRLSRA